jgi:hypothetical protein
MQKKEIITWIIILIVYMVFGTIYELINKIPSHNDNLQYLQTLYPNDQFYYIPPTAFRFIRIEKNQVHIINMQLFESKIESQYQIKKE